MKRLMFAAAAILAAVLPATSAAAVILQPIPPMRIWGSSAASAAITSCTSGNSGVLDGVTTLSGNYKMISGSAVFCRYDGDVRSVGLEFFTSAGASGVFVRFNDDYAEIRHSLQRDWSPIRAICVSAAPTDRLACYSVNLDAQGNVALTEIATTNPLITPAGPMYKCGGRIDDPITDPTCATCV